MLCKVPPPPNAISGFYREKKTNSLYRVCLRKKNAEYKFK